MASKTCKNTVDEGSKSDLSVMADTTPDLFMKEQVSICMRYVEQKEIPSECYATGQVNFF